MCSATTIYLFDVETQVLHDASHLMPSDGFPKVLDVVRSPLDLSQAFILTTTHIINVIAKENSQGKIVLETLGRSRYQGDANDPSLRLELSLGTYIKGQKACFACVRSTKHTRLIIVWFVYPAEGEAAHVYLNFLDTKAPAPFLTVSMVPVRRYSPVDTPTPISEANARFLQVVTLGYNMEISGSLWALSDKIDIKLEPPDICVTHLHQPKDKKPRSTFAVPDDYNESTGKKMVRNNNKPKNPAVKKQAPIDFYLAARAMVKAVNRACRPGSSDGLTIDDVEFKCILDAMKRGKVKGWMPRHSL